MPAINHLSLLIFMAASLLTPSAVQAQLWPNKPIKLVVPFAPGGSNDNIARLLATKLGGRLGQPVVVENKGGSGGTIGTDFVAKSAPDGNTLLLVSTSITTNAASGKKLPYDPIKDLQPIGRVAASPFVIVVSPEMQVNSLKEFIDLARVKPSTINYGSAGIGGMNHLGTELFASTAKIHLTHVPYKGISLAFTDLMGGNLQMLLPSLAAATQQIKAGKMKGLAVTSAQRSRQAPDLPTASEAGLPGFTLEVWFGLMAPAGLAPATLKRLNEELNAILAMGDVQELLAREGASPKPGTPEELGTLIKVDLARWSKLIKDNNIQVD